MEVHELAQMAGAAPVRVHGIDRLGHEFDYLTYALIAPERTMIIGLGTLVDVGAVIAVKSKDGQTEYRVLSIEESAPLPFQRCGSCIVTANASPRRGQLLD